MFLGDLKLVEKPQTVTLGPHDFTNIKASVKVASTENGIIFGNIGKLRNPIFLLYGKGQARVYVYICCYCLQCMTCLVRRVIATVLC